MNTPDPYMMTLQMYDYDVPCIVQLIEPSCESRATWVLYWTHVQETDCGMPPVPVCDQHKKMMTVAHVGFWAAWFPTPEVDCTVCGKQVVFDRAVAIPKGE